MVEMVRQLCGGEETGVPQSRRSDPSSVPVVTDADENWNIVGHKHKCCLQGVETRKDTAC